MKIIHHFVCSYCNNSFSRIDYPSRFKFMRENYQRHYCSKRCAMLGAREGYRPTQGLTVTKDGHVLSREPNHPNHNRNSQVPLAHLIMEEHLGRYLEMGEVVHHIDGNPSNNDINNLQLMSLGEHVTLHNNLKRREGNGRFIKNLS